MEKINRQRAPKGTVTVREKGNSFEARVTLEMVSLIDGIEKNPRLSRTALTEKEARRRLGELIVDIFFKAQQASRNKQVFTEECSLELDKFEEYQEEKRKKFQEISNEYTLFPNIAKEWLHWKKNQVNPSTNKTISPKTLETYINTMQSHVLIDFEKYHIQDLTKEIVEDYINSIRKKTPRIAKDLFLMIRAILTYARDQKGIISKVPEFTIKFAKKKRSGKKKIPYLPAPRQKVWLDILEKDSREFALLFATLLQTGMRPEERLWFKMEMRVI